MCKEGRASELGSERSGVEHKQKVQATRFSFLSERSSETTSNLIMLKWLNGKYSLDGNCTIRATTFQSLADNGVARFGLTRDRLFQLESACFCFSLLY